ncbi:MAG: methylated-DNA--[protein]-cysteine S-methyltransferase [Chloroflexaceae bacterium]|nr:methylated-DNA--[protein]-cysteine S-methyltransferase [Chloroflexaceae bacterium]
MMYFTYCDSPLDGILLVSDGDCLTGLYLLPEQTRLRPGKDWVRDNVGLLVEVERQIKAYFAGELRKFTIPVRLQGTAFQQRVWQLLPEIGFGETVSYGELAKQLGQPQAVRAVGSANGRNPVCIIVPCHRVVGAKGQLTGYSGGVKRKQWLLTHEQKIAASS